LGTGCSTFPAVPRSTQPSTLCGTVKWVLVNARAGFTVRSHMTSDLSSMLEVCYKRDVLYKSTFTLLNFTLLYSSGVCRFFPESSSLFTSSEAERRESANPPTANTYSLFSQSPWPVGLRSQNLDSSSQFLMIHIIISAKWTEWNWRTYCFHLCLCVSVHIHI